MKALCKKLLLTAFILFGCGLIVSHQSTASDEVDDNLKYHPAVPNYAPLVMLSLIVMISFGVEWFLKNIKSTIPPGAIMVIIGHLWGIIMYKNDVLRLATNIVNFSPFKLYYIFAPAVIFNLAFCLDITFFMKILPQAVIIGIPVSLLTAVIFGGLCRLVLNKSWDLVFGMTFGMACQPIFPKTITQLLRQQCFRSRQVGVLLEAEALFSFNVVNLIFLYQDMITSKYVIHWYQYVGLFIRTTAFSIICGYLFGHVGRYLVRKMCNNKFSVLVLMTTFPYITFSLSQKFITFSGDICVMIVGLMLCQERPILTKETEYFLLEFWETMGFTLNVIVCTIYAMSTSCYVAPFMSFSDHALILGTYLLYTCVRFIIFLIFSPLISKFGYGMDLKSMLLCVWGGLKGSYGVLLITSMNEVEKAKNLNIAKFYVIGLYMIFNLVNGGTIRKVLEFLELNKISTTRQINMLNCMKHIHDKRDRAIAWLKYDKFLCEINWELIREWTTFKNPYLRQIDEGDETENVPVPGYRYMYCSDCLKEVLLEPTPNEFKEMTKDAKIRVLKAKKMSYSRQHENGMISNEGMRILSQAIEMAMDSKDTKIRVEDLYRRFSEEKWYERLARKRLEAIKKSRRKVRPPLTYWRRLCYHLVLESSFEKTMIVIVALHCCLLLVDYYYHPSLVMGGRKEHIIYLDYFITVMKSIFTIIYTVEFIIKVLALSWKNIIQDGCVSYFKSFWNIQDFIFMIISWCSTEISINELNNCANKTLTVKRSVVEIFEMLRFLRLLRIFGTFYQNILKQLEKIAESKMAFTYELAKCYSAAESEVLGMLQHIIANEKIRDDIRRQMEIDRVTITKLMGIVQKERPWIAITVKTKQVIRTILSGLYDSVMVLKSSGFVDTQELDLLLESLNELHKDVNLIKKVQPSAPKIIFKEVPWMSDDDEVINFLFENVTAQTFEPGEVIFDEGHVANVIYVVVTGVFMVSYTPNPYILRSCKEYGVLPIVDYHFGSTYDEQSVDYIVSGNCIGEHSILTLRPFNCRVTADTHSQVYVLSYGILNRAMQLSPDPSFGLEARMWKEVGIRIAIPVLMSTPVYQSHSKDQIKQILERSFVPDLSSYKLFVVTEVIEDIILIEGLVADMNTNKKYIAPCRIARTIRKLILPNNSLINIPIDVVTKLLIIPVKGMTECDIIVSAEDACELTLRYSTSKCLQHAAQDRMRRRRRRLSRRKTLASLESQAPSIMTTKSRSSVLGKASMTGSDFLSTDTAGSDSTESFRMEDTRKESNKMFFSD